MGYFQPNYQQFSNNFGKVSPLSMFSIISTKVSLYIPNIDFGLGFEFGPQRNSLRVSIVGAYYSTYCCENYWMESNHVRSAGAIHKDVRVR